jgi:hypothetical protein
MPSEITIKAINKKDGMSRSELKEGMESLKEDVAYRVKATVGFKGQLQSITFTEDE